MRPLRYINTNKNMCRKLVARCASYSKAGVVGGLCRPAIPSMGTAKGLDMALTRTLNRGQHDPRRHL